MPFHNHLKSRCIKTSRGEKCRLFYNQVGDMLH